MFRFFFFFQAEDGIRDYKVTGVQTCALPISSTCPISRALPDKCQGVNSTSPVTRFYQPCAICETPLRWLSCPAVASLLTRYRLLQLQFKFFSTKGEV